MASKPIGELELPRAANLWVSVNLSPRQLATANPVGLCAQLLVEIGVSPTALHLELTEGAVMADIENSIDRLRGLRDLGVTVAIDDFGTGYSSLSYLRRLPVGMLKIDHSFVQGLGSNADDLAIVQAIINLAHSMQLELCAEGIEERAQNDLLLELGCELGQGFLYGRPMPPDALMAWATTRIHV